MERWQDTTLATQWRVLLYVQDYIETHGYAPTYSEIGAAVAVTPRVAQSHVRSLAKFGWLRVGRGWRNIRTVKRFDPSRYSERWQNPTVLTAPRILSYLATHPQSSAREIADALGLTVMAVYPHVYQLRDAGRVVDEGY